MLFVLDNLAPVGNVDAVERTFASKNESGVLVWAFAQSLSQFGMYVDRHEWNPSRTKVIDNAIVGFVRLVFHRSKCDSKEKPNIPWDSSVQNNP